LAKLVAPIIAKRTAVAMGPGLRRDDGFLRAQ
jgi:hypothetical protein